MCHPVCIFGNQTNLQATPEEDEGPYLGYYDFKELEFSKARYSPIAVVTDDLGLMVDDRYRKVSKNYRVTHRVVLKFC